MPDHLPEGQHPAMGLCGSVTFVHPVEDLIRVAFFIAALVFLPHGAIFTAQHHELTVPTAMGRKVGDLHYHRAAGTEQMVGKVHGCGGACLWARGWARGARAGGLWEGNLVLAWRKEGGPTLGQETSLRRVPEMLQASSHSPPGPRDQQARPQSHSTAELPHPWTQSRE